MEIKTAPLQRHTSTIRLSTIFTTKISPRRAIYAFLYVALMRHIRIGTMFKLGMVTRLMPTIRVIHRPKVRFKHASLLISQLLCVAKLYRNAQFSSRKISTLSMLSFLSYRKLMLESLILLLLFNPTLFEP